MERVWLYPGARVAVYRRRTTPELHIRTVDKLTATQVIVEGRRYRRDTLAEVGRSGAWEVPYRLLPLDDPQVLDASAVSRMRQLHSALGAALRELHTGGGGRVTALALLDDWQARLDHTRNAIARTVGINPQETP